ncbi:MAG: squalene/phytoene synthase family protein [Betaproteobacteria bacterium]|nr:squalene/phytoene synthase family protein [Betaproteobacteria bacterium]
MDPGHLGTAFHGGGHYENFPVASWLLPAEMRGALLALYRFARTGDDLADEGNLAPEVRRAGLHALRIGLHGQNTQSVKPAEHQEIGSALRVELLARQLDIVQAEKLLGAFEMDVLHEPYPTISELMVYCRYSADPIGRIMLATAKIIDDPNADCPITAASDAICSGLQLVNFAQDMGQDCTRQRIYVPRQWWPEGWLPAAGAQALSDQVKHQWATQMARLGQDHLVRGAVLLNHIRRSARGPRMRLGLEIAMVIEGGLAISRRVLADPLAVWRKSPVLSRTDLAVIVLQAMMTFVHPHRHRT